MYKNRYGETVEFIEINKNKIWFKVTETDGTPQKYWRCGWENGKENTEEYCFVDSSGGPYIGVGHNMGVEDKQFEGRIVKYITREEDKFIIHV